MPKLQHMCTGILQQKFQPLKPESEHVLSSSDVENSSFCLWGMTSHEQSTFQCYRTYSTQQCRRRNESLQMMHRGEVFRDKVEIVKTTLLEHLLCAKPFAHLDMVKCNILQFHYKRIVFTENSYSDMGLRRAKTVTSVGSSRKRERFLFTSFRSSPVLSTQLAEPRPDLTSFTQSQSQERHQSLTSCEWCLARAVAWEPQAWASPQTPSLYLIKGCWTSRSAFLGPIFLACEMG